MKTWPRVLMGAFALSLAFNLFVGIGFLRSRMTLTRMGTPAERRTEVERRLHLDSHQRRYFVRAWLDAQLQRRELRDLGRRIGDEYWEELARPEPNEARLDAIVEQSIEAEKRARLLSTAHMVAVLRTLNTEQRREYLRLARSVRGADTP